MGSELCLTSAAVSSLHRYTFPAVAVLLYSTLLGPAFHHLWIYAGSGNANFFYAITLVRISFNLHLESLSERVANPSTHGLRSGVWHC